MDVIAARTPQRINTIQCFGTIIYANLYRENYYKSPGSFRQKTVVHWLGQYNALPDSQWPLLDSTNRSQSTRLHSYSQTFRKSIDMSRILESI